MASKAFKSKKRKKRIKQLLLAGLVVFLCGSLASWKVGEPFRRQGQLEHATQHEFLRLMAEEAVPIAKSNDLYPSVMIAQAVLESDWGESLLSQEAHNYYGIKGDYKGETYTISTQEDDGTGTLYTIDSNFRKYPHYRSSLEDYAILMKKGVSWDNLYYAGTWVSKTSSYKDATAHLQGHYATDTNYASKLNALIEQYQLTQYDL